MNKLKEGDIFLVKQGDNIYVDSFPNHFLFSNSAFDFSLSSGSIKIGENNNGFDTSVLAGKYIVKKTEFSGGGTGNGPGDVYPNGHRVFASKIHFECITNFEINFYQSGCFTCMIENPKVVGRAKCKWEIK